MRIRLIGAAFVSAIAAGVVAYLASEGYKLGLGSGAFASTFALVLFLLKSSNGDSASHAGAGAAEEGREGGEEPHDQHTQAPYGSPYGQGGYGGGDGESEVLMTTRLGVPSRTPLHPHAITSDHLTRILTDPNAPDAAKDFALQMLNARGQMELHQLSQLGGPAGRRGLSSDSPVDEAATPAGETGREDLRSRVAPSVLSLVIHWIQGGRR